MEDSKKYFISLDNVDIEYLPRLKKYLQGNDCDKVPLWSVVNASTSFADEICEFELFSNDDKDTTTSECDENNSTEQCHICDTQVPTAYMQAHCKGEKHRVCAAIIRHALRRATQHAECIPFAPTGVSAQPVSLTHSEGTYFCDHCALAVNVKNKGKHEKTKEHQVSVIHDRLLNGLLITYTDKGRVVADSRYKAGVSNESDDVSVEEDLSRDDDVTTALPDNLEDTDQKNILKTDTFPADTSHTKKSDKGKESSDEEESDAESIDIIDNNVDLSGDNWAKLSSNLITDQDDVNQGDAKTFNEHIDIVTVSNGIVRVPAKNYHGISYKLTGGISCLICQKTIADIEIHIQELGHIELLSVPVADRNCIRQISPLWHHCIICNKLVQSIPLHKSSSPHQSKLLSSDVTSKKQQRIQKRLQEMSYCHVCKCNVEKNNKENHFNGAKHAWNLSRTTFTADNRVLHYHFKRDEDKIECSICNIIVRDDETDEHIVSDGHENNYKRFLVANHISKLNHKAFYCDCCKLKFRQKVTTEIEHVQSISHKIHKTKVSGPTPKVSIPVNVNSIECAEHLDVATIQLLYLLETSNLSKRVTCKVCKHTFRNKDTQIKNHMNQSYHQYNIDALLYVNKIKNNLDGTYFCEVCRSAIDHTKEFDHINSNDHKINLRNVPSLESGEEGNESSKAAETPAEKASYDQEINRRNALNDMTGNYMSGVAVSLAENPTSNVDILNRHNVDNFKHTKHSHLKKIKDVIVCLICNVEVRANDGDAHIESEEHNNNYMCFFVANHLTKSKSGYNCHACNLKTNKSEIVHANKKKHKLKIPVNKPKTSAPVYANSIQDIEFLDRKLLYLFESSDEPGEIRCTVCKVSMKSNSTEIKEHLAEQYHKFNVDALLYVNKIRNEHDGTYFCEVCHKTIDNTKEIDHINSNDHKINVRNIPLSWRQRGDGAPVNPTENPASSPNIKKSYDSEIHMKNTHLACGEQGNDMARVAVSPAENTTSNEENDHHTIDKAKRELHSSLNENKDKIVCFVRNADVRADDIDAHNESNHNINVRNVVLSCRQIGDDMSGAAVTPSEEPSSSGNIKDNNDHEINVKNSPLACREKSDDICRAAMTPVDKTSNVENNLNTVDNSKCEILSQLEEIKDELESLKCNADLCVDGFDSHNETNHNINVRNKGDDDDMTGVPVTRSENPTSSVNTKNSYDSDMNVKNAALACGEKGNDTARAAVPTKTYLTYFLENTTSNEGNDHNTVDNSKHELHSYLEKFGDEKVCCTCNVDVRTDDIDSHYENNHNISRNRSDDNMAEAAVTTSENSSSSVNVKDGNDLVKNCNLACTEKGDDIAMTPPENTTSNVENDHNTIDNSKCEILSHLEEIKDEIVCFKRDANVRADGIDSPDESVHNIVVRNIPSSWTQKGYDMAEAAVSPAENACSNVPIKDGETSHASNRTKNCETAKSSEVQINSNHDMKRYLSAVPSNPRQVMCQICNIVINNVDCNIKEHLDGRRHKSNYEKFLDDKKNKEEVKAIKEILRCCIDVETLVVKPAKNDIRNTEAICSGDTPAENSSSDVTVNENYYHEIIERKAPLACRKDDGDASSVAVSLAEYPISNVHILDRNTGDNSERELHDHLKNVKDEIVCSICNAELRDVDIDGHIESDKHNNNYKTFLVENQITKHRNRFFCYICRCYLKKNMCETDHIKSKIHVDNISVHKPTPSIPVDVNSIQDIEFLDHATVKLLYLLESTDEPIKIRCKVCKLIMKCNFVEIRKHMADKSHQFNIDALLYVNKIKNKPDGTYFCEVCRITIDHTKMINHINSKYHKMNVISSKKRGIDIAYASVTPTEHYASNINVKETLNLIPAENHTQAIFVQSDVSLQAIKDIEDFDKIIHIDSEKYFCECCSVHLVKGTVAEHVQKYNHAINVANYMQKPKTSTSKLKENNIEKCALGIMKNEEIPNVKLISCKRYDNFKDGEMSYAYSRTTGCSEVQKEPKYDMHSCLSPVPSKPHEVMCQICNTVIPNTDANKKDHLNGRRHKSNYENFVVKQKNHVQTIKEKVPCDINVKVLTAAKTTNNDTDKIEKLVRAQAIKSIENFRSTEVKTNSKHDMNSYLSAVPSKPYEVLCQICNTVISKNDAHLKDHFSGKRHKLNYEKFVVEQKNQMKTVKEKVPCDINVKVPTAAKTTNNYTQKIEAFVKAQAIKSIENIGSTEVKTDSKHDMKSYLSVVPSKPHEVMCQVCNTVITKNDANIKEHLNGTRHKTNYGKFLVDKKKQLKSVTEKVPGDIKVKVPVVKTTKHDNHKAEALVKAQSIFFKHAEGVLFCRCCNTEVKNTQQDVNLHLSGWRHKVKSSAILAENGLRVDKNKIYCGVCEVFLQNLDGMTHIDSSKHKTKASAKALDYASANKDVIALPAKTNETNSGKCNIIETTNREQKSVQDNLSKAKEEAKVFCDICKVYVTNMPVHLNSNQHKLNVNLKIDDDITCKVCNLKVNKNDLKQHENGALHNENLKEMLLKNQISQKWNGVLYCQLCDLFFTPITLIKHVENENHKKLMYRMVRL